MCRNLSRYKLSLNGYLHSIVLPANIILATTTESNSGVVHLTFGRLFASQPLHSSGSYSSSHPSPHSRDSPHSPHSAVAIFTTFTTLNLRHIHHIHHTQPSLRLLHHRILIRDSTPRIPRLLLIAISCALTVRPSSYKTVLASC